MKTLPAAGVLLGLLLLPACRNKDTTGADTGAVQAVCDFYEDLDGDGWGSDTVVEDWCDSPAATAVPDTGDCDDGNGAVNPGQAEVAYDGLDNDCDDATPDDDLDGDGVGVADDCDDEDAAVFPGATETCNDLDDDCNGQVDDAVGGTWYADDDQDGYGDPDTATQSCEGATGYVADATDCDDADGDVHPGAVEVCNGIDDDCDLLTDDDDPNVTDQLVWYRDGDGDGFGDDATSVAACEAPATYGAASGDCDDTDPAIHPDAVEICDGVDNDCDGDLDDDDDGVVGQSTWYVDSDGDGHGAGTFTLDACFEPTGMAATSDDCDDAEALTFPGANETCDSADNDCDGTVDEASDDAGTWYRDGDGDGYGDATDSISDCDGGTAYVSDATDCDDGDGAVNPGADEVCNGSDDDCDGLVDDDDPDVTDPSTWYTDADGDGFGDAGAAVTACEAPSDGVADDTDCDDSTATVNPDAPETCSGVDDDCDGLVDDDDPDVSGTTTWYLDFDGDGYGTSALTVDACEAPTGYVDNDSDCEDSSSDASPDGVEVCDGLDNDCDGLTDDDDDSLDASAGGTWYGDADGDGYGDAGALTEACEAPSGTVANADDCDDSDAAVSPLGTELCNDGDDDCDGSVDEDAVDGDTWYSDGDGDGFGDAASSTVACDAPTDFVASDDDCDDADAGINPDADEVCDGVDNDCDGVTDPDTSSDATTWYDDDDGDGFGDGTAQTQACEAPSGTVDNGADCDDADGAVKPGAVEACDGVDNDCNGTIDDEGASGETTWYADADGDGEGDGSSPTDACDLPSGHVSNADDCDDGDATVNTHATELCDGVDNDCDGTTDVGAADELTFYADLDGDGYGNVASTSTGCEAPTGTVATGGDCDDSDTAINPDGEEVCDGADNDCDGSVDVGASDETTWYLDADGDGWGGLSFTLDACDQPTGYLADTGDCDDLDAAVNPDATELCNGADDDCDGSTDEPDAADALTWVEDGDSDGYGGSGGGTTTACSEPTGYAATSDDCDDTDASVNPGASEICNGVDDDCDGSADGGVMGADAACAADSCLHVLEDGSPTGTDTFWIDPSSPQELTCDFGTVGGGWGWRLSLTVDNSTGGPLASEQVPVVLDTATLIAAGQLEADGADLRVFTHDGPLLSYWIETVTLDTAATVVWVTFDDLDTGTTDLTLTVGNPDTERRSLAWWFDPFETDTIGLYDTLYDSGWGTPTFTVDTSATTLGTDSTNMDYFAEAMAIDVDEPVYVEIEGWIHDDDTIGPMLVTDQGYVTASACNDYNGVDHDGGIEGIVLHSTEPSGHYQGSYLLAMDNVVNMSSPHRIGLSWDGAALGFWLDGVQEDSVGDSLSVLGVGLSTFANSGSPGAEFEYLWVGGEAIDFDPEGLSSAATASVGAVAGF